MTINTNQMLSISEVNQNFSKATRIADKQGSVVIFKNNKPVYVMLNLQAHPMIELSDDEKVEVVAKRILEKHRKAFEVLAEWLIGKREKIFFLVFLLSYILSFVIVSTNSSLNWYAYIGYLNTHWESRIANRKLYWQNIWLVQFYFRHNKLRRLLCIMRRTQWN